ncbi:MAG: hypothetical protein ACOY4I_03245 [Bacillota bacterium]
MKEDKLMAEMKVGMEKIRNSEALEINLHLSQPPEARRRQPPSRPRPSYPGYPPPATGRRDYPGENSEARKSGSEFHKSANVRVNSVSVNVRTTSA